MKPKGTGENNTVEVDRAFKEPIDRLSCLSVETEFGTESEFYLWATKELASLYHRAGGCAEEITQQWRKTYSRIYGDKLSPEIFINHVYLTVLVKSILFLKICSGKGKPQEIPLILSGEFFTARQLSLFDFDLSGWLVNLILDKVFSVWKNTVPPKVLDPACGSGTFLFHAAKFLQNEFSLSPRQVLEHLTGFDINPIAALVSKTNLLLTLDEFETVRLPIYPRDALRDDDLFDTSGFGDDFDIILGNPPWIVLRSIKSREYQDFIKKEMFRYHLINNGNIHLHTQLDTSTLFFRKCAHKYLGRGGIIAFVMPRSVLGSTYQHANFRKFDTPDTKLLTIVDLEHVKPLFKTPSCVLIARKAGGHSYPVPLEKYSGELPENDLSLLQIKAHLTIENEYYVPPANQQKASYYYNRFKVGVSIFPRSLYFVDLHSIRDHCIRVTSSRSILQIVKEPWRIELEGKVEEDFLFCTILPYEMLPFGFLKIYPVILPLDIDGAKYRILGLTEMKRQGFSGAYDWFKHAQKIWDENKTTKANERFPKLTDRLNYNNLLSFQHPDNKYIVLYNATGKDVTSCVIDKAQLVPLDVDDSKVHPQAFIADVKTWFFETNSAEEAHYLCAILNSTLLSRLIKPYQPRGLFGARAIHRRPLQFPIPRFDRQNSLHLELSSLTEKLQKMVKDHLTENKSKHQVRKAVGSEIASIDGLVQELLQYKEGPDAD